MFLISARPNGLEFLKEALKEQESASRDYQNIFDTIDNELKEARKQNDEYTVVMPSFKIGSSLQAEEYLRQVIQMMASVNLDIYKFKWNRIEIT